jgi:hypothetical protein
MGEHIWTIEKWTKNPHIVQENRPRGLRLVFERGVDPTLRSACLEFAKWLRREYVFPARVRVYVKRSPRIKAKDGELVCGTFLMPGDDRDDPYIRIAAGDYSELCGKYDEKRAIYEILWCIAHELTHYYQWINGLMLTEIGEERQAKRYAFFVADEYLEAIGQSVGEQKPDSSANA